MNDNLVVAKATFYGIVLYFAAECKDSRGVTLWRDYKLENGKILKAHEGRFGAAFSVNKKADLRLSVSFFSFENAVKMLECEPSDFDEVRRGTYLEWYKGSG